MSFSGFRSAGFSVLSGKVSLSLGILFLSFLVVSSTAALAADSGSADTQAARTATKMVFATRGFAIQSLEKTPLLVDISVSDSLAAPMSKTGKVKGDPSTPIAREGHLAMRGKVYSLLVEKLESNLFKAKIMKRGSQKASDGDSEAAIKPKNLMIGTIELKWAQDETGGDGSGEPIGQGKLKIKDGEEEIDSGDSSYKLLVRGPMDSPGAGSAQAAITDALFDAYGKGGDLTGYFNALDTANNIMTNAQNQIGQVTGAALNTED